MVHMQTHVFEFLPHEKLIGHPLYHSMKSVFSCADTTVKELTAFATKKRSFNLIILACSFMFA